jgi:hypothetical protein
VLSVTPGPSLTTIKEGEHTVVVHFHGATGDYLNIGWSLKPPSAKESFMVRAYKKQTEYDWTIIFDPKPSNPTLNLLWDKQIAGDYDVQLLFVVDQPVSSNWLLAYASELQPEVTYKISDDVLTR